MSRKVWCCCQNWMGFILGELLLLGADQSRDWPATGADIVRGRRGIRLALDGELAGCELVNLLSEDHNRAEGETAPGAEEPYGHLWYRVCGFGLFVERSEV
jgi:hypothetical protein